MVPSTNDLDALKALLPTPPSSPSASVEAARRGKHSSNNNIPTGLAQGVDSVQLSPNALKAAAEAKTGEIARFNATAAPRANAVTPVQAAPFNAAPRSGPAAPAGRQPLPQIQPAQLIAGAQVAINARLAAEPEVRPGRVQEAAQHLASGGASNAQLAEKLLTEF